MKIKFSLFFAPIFLLLFSLNCGKKNNQKVYKQFDTIESSSNNNQKDAISPEQGGNGFEKIAGSLGWETNTNPKLIGDPQAIKGGSLTLKGDDDFPPTFRGVGQDTRHQILSLLESNVYETLLSINYETMQYQPILATHWKISDDKLTYWFRINPDARWSDGREVIAMDVVATFNLLADEGHGDPNIYTLYGDSFELPLIAESKYIVRIKSKKVDWRTFIYAASSAAILPSYYLDKVDGAGYVDKYQYEMLPGTGPYILDKNKTTKDNNGIIVLHKRSDFWGENLSVNTGFYNFDTIKYIFMDDELLEVERLRKGTMDMYVIWRSSIWAQNFSPEEDPLVKRGLLMRTKVFNFLPGGINGLAFNTLEEPYDDIRIRKAFSLLWNVDELNEKLFFNEYEYAKSYFNNSPYENPTNPDPKYDPNAAIILLNEAGWTKKTGEKWLTKDDKIFEFDFMTSQSTERIFTSLQQDLVKVGIKMNMVTLTRQSQFEKVMKRKFTVHWQGWTASMFPNIEGQMHSKFSEAEEVTNITGMADPAIDKRIELYNSEWNMSKRVKIAQEIDSIATRLYHYAPGWHSAYGARVVHWNKFGMPKSGISYSGNWQRLIDMWWYDPDKEKELHKAINNSSMTIGTGEINIIDYWNTQKK